MIRGGRSCRLKYIARGENTKIGDTWVAVCVVLLEVKCYVYVNMDIITYCGCLGSRYMPAEQNIRGCNFENQNYLHVYYCKVVSLSIIKKHFSSKHN